MIGLRRTPEGFVVLLPGDDPDACVDALLEGAYAEEFCLAPSFDAAFVSSLARAGFLVMAQRLNGGAAGTAGAVLLPKLHLRRSVLEFSRLHASKSILRVLDRYELERGADLSYVMDRCAAAHGDDWLVPELRAAFLQMDQKTKAGDGASVDAAAGAHPEAFILRRAGLPVAGEFGLVAGGAYTSYSGYRDEASAGTAQLVLTGRLLRDAGFDFWDLGMPMEYKDRLGATTMDRRAFIDSFRAARLRSPAPGPSDPRVP